MTTIEVAQGCFVKDPEYGGSWPVEDNVVSKVAVAGVVEKPPVDMNEQHPHYADWVELVAPVSLFD